MAKSSDILAVTGGVLSRTDIDVEGLVVYVGKCSADEEVAGDGTDAFYCGVHLEIEEALFRRYGKRIALVLVQARGHECRRSIESDQAGDP